MVMRRFSPRTSIFDNLPDFFNNSGKHEASNSNDSMIH